MVQSSSPIFMEPGVRCPGMSVSSDSFCRRLLTGIAILTMMPLLAGSADVSLPAADNGDDEVLELHSLTVRGKKKVDPARQPLAPVASQELTTESITREDMESSKAIMAADALTYSPSVAVRRQGRKNAISLNLRGSGNVNVLFDGVNIGTKEDYRFIDVLPTSVLESIEVIRDSTGLLYGPPQLSGPGGTVGYGGVINLSLLSPSKEFSGQAGVEIGRFNENVEHLHISGPLTEDLGYLLSLNRSFYGGPGGENMESDFDHILGRLVYTYGNGSTVTLNVLHDTGEREFQNASEESAFYGRTEEFNMWRMTTTTLSVNHIWNDELSTEIQTYYRDLENNYRWYEKGTDDAVRESKRGLVVRQTIKIPERNVMRLGAEMSTWSNPTGKLYYVGTERREKDYSLYLQDEYELLPEKLTLDAGVRWDRRYLDKGVIANGPPNVTPGTVLKFGTLEDVWLDPVVSYSTGLNYRLTESQTITCRWALSRQATAPEMISSTTRDPMDDVDEERYELGYRIVISPKLTLGITGFHTVVTNGMIYAGLVGGYPTWNSADFERDGVELVAEGDLTEELGYFANWTYINATVEDSGADEDHDDTTPRYQAAGGLRYHHGGWKSNLSVKYTPTYLSDFGLNAAKGYTEARVGSYWLLDANVGYTWDSDERFSHEVYCGVRNGFNEHYETIPGWEDPGRSMYAGYTLRW